MIALKTRSEGITIGGLDGSLNNRQFQIDADLQLANARDVNTEGKPWLGKGAHRHRSGKSGQVEARIEYRAFETGGGALRWVLDVCDCERGVWQTSADTEVHACGALECATDTDLVGCDGAETEDAGDGEACAWNGRFE